MHISSFLQQVSTFSLQIQRAKNDEPQPMPVQWMVITSFMVITVA